MACFTVDGLSSGIVLRLIECSDCSSWSGCLILQLGAMSESRQKQYSLVCSSHRELDLAIDCSSVWAQSPLNLITRSILLHPMPRGSPSVWWRCGTACCPSAIHTPRYSASSVFCKNKGNSPTSRLTVCDNHSPKRAEEIPCVSGRLEIKCSNRLRPPLHSDTWTPGSWCSAQTALGASPMHISRRCS